MSISLSTPADSSRLCRYVLQQYNTQLSSPNDVAGNAVAGFGNLGEYSLSAKPIMLAAEKAQNAAGFQAPSPDSSDLVKYFNNVDYANAPLEDLIQFNLAVCDLDVADPDLSNQSLDSQQALSYYQGFCNGDQQCLVCSTRSLGVIAELTRACVECGCLQHPHLLWMLADEGQEWQGFSV
jgi:hypothetical protein